VTAIGANAEDACANCGGPGDGLEDVRRVYVTVDDQGRATGSETVTDPERWCVSCRSLYPHEVGSDPSPEKSGGDGPPAATGPS
jgi:hypothetical protein